MVPTAKAKKLDEQTINLFSKMYSDVQRKIKELEEEKQEIKQAMFKHFDLTYGKGKPAEIECMDGYKFAREQRESKKIDEVQLKDELEPDVWKKVTVVDRHLDENKLKKAITDGLIDKQVVKKCIVTKTTFAFTHPLVKRSED